MKYHFPQKIIYANIILEPYIIHAIVELIFYGKP